MTGKNLFNKVIVEIRYCVAVFVVTCVVMTGLEMQCGAVSTMRWYASTGIDRLNKICRPEVGMSRIDMLQRFDGVQLYVLSEYDQKDLKCDVARWFYQIGDSDVFFTFKYSWETGRIEEWKMQNGISYREYFFDDYLRPIGIRKDKKNVS